MKPESYWRGALALLLLLVIGGFLLFIPVGIVSGFGKQSIWAVFPFASLLLFSIAAFVLTALKKRAGFFLSMIIGICYAIVNLNFIFVSGALMYSLLNLFPLVVLIGLIFFTWKSRAIFELKKANKKIEAALLVGLVVVLFFASVFASMPFMYMGEGAYCSSSDPSKMPIKASLLSRTGSKSGIILQNITGGNIVIEGVEADKETKAGFSIADGKINDAQMAASGMNVNVAGGANITIIPAYDTPSYTYLGAASYTISYKDYANLSRKLIVVCNGEISGRTFIGDFFENFFGITLIE
jgi:hypothetical protein